MTKPQPTPLPWIVWRLAPDSDQQQRHIITTADGEQEITGIVHDEADARHMVRCVNSHGRLVEALIACANLFADYDESDGEEGEAWREAVAAIAEATDGQNVPPGYKYEAKDCDGENIAESDDAGRRA